LIRNIATALIITFGVILMMLGFVFVLDYFDLMNRECCQSQGSVLVVPEVQLQCPIIEELPTATPTVVLCECDCTTETPVVPTATPTHGTPPPTDTRTPEPTNTPVPSSTPEPTPTDIPPPTEVPPEPTDKPKCNRGLGNNEEGCDPGNSGGNPGNAGEDNEPGGPPGQGNH
jgi:hypothetical protein